MPLALLTLALAPRPFHCGTPRALLTLVQLPDRATVARPASHVTIARHSARVGSPTIPPWNAARLAGSQSSSPHSYRNRLTRQLVEALPRHPPSPLRERD